jgi:hypothetical protein
MKRSKAAFGGASYPPPRAFACVRGAARARPWITRLTTEIELIVNDHSTI